MNYSLKVLQPEASPLTDADFALFRIECRSNITSSQEKIQNRAKSAPVKGDPLAVTPLILCLGNN